MKQTHLEAPIHRGPFRIKQRMTCQSSYLVYLATCKKCKGQYVGKSQTAFKIRHSNHKQKIKHGIGGLGQHYGPNRWCNYEDISSIWIEKSTNLCIGA